MSNNHKSAGKLPPQAIDLEQAVLGACILNVDNFLDIANILKPEMFYRDAHKKIYSELCSMSAIGDPIDILSVHANLKKRGEAESIGGAYYITQLTDMVTHTTDTEFNARIISQKYMERELISLSSQTITDCYDETCDVFEILDNYELKRDEIVNHVVSKSEVSNQEAITEFMRELDRQSQLSDKEVTGVPTGFDELNKITGGWQQSFAILAARPAMGKTAMMLKFVLESAKAGKPVLVFSLEMSRQQLISRLVSMITEIPLQKITRPKALVDHEWQRLHSAMTEIMALPIYWDDSAEINMLEISSKAKRMKRKHNIEYIVIDYLQLISPTDKKVIREQQISQISRGLKVLSKQLDVPVLALSQLSRAVESRPGNSKRPMLSDLRESGSLEQDADIVMFLYRAEYYGQTEDEIGESTAGKGEVIIAKHRNGQTDTVEVGWSGEKTKFYDLESDENFAANFIEIDKKMQLPDNNINAFANFDSSPGRVIVDIADEPPIFRAFEQPVEKPSLFNDNDEYPF